MSDPEKVWLPVEHAPSSRGMPTSAMFDDANGGEYRKSLHIYAPPFAQLVESPSKINGIAMQIDTWHRDAMNLTGSRFVPGPVPRRALAPTSGPDAIYSGLLECAHVPPSWPHARPRGRPRAASHAHAWLPGPPSLPPTHPPRARAPHPALRALTAVLSAVRSPARALAPRDRQARSRRASR